MKKLFKLVKRLFILGALLAISALLAIYICNRAVEKSTENKLFESIATIPKHNVALVLGANKKSSRGNVNLFFKYRMEAAAALYKAGKIKHILVSGDNHTEGYDEPTDMKNYLVALGVPEHKITLDYAGFRTLDSVVRAKEIFGLTEFTVISQQFHNERALFLCNHFDINAVAYNAKDVPQKYALKTKIREYFARVKACMDVYILNKNPKFLGKKEYIEMK